MPPFFDSNFYGSTFVLNSCFPSTYSNTVADLTALCFSSTEKVPETSSKFSVLAKASLMASPSNEPARSTASLMKYTVSYPRAWNEFGDSLYF